MPFKNWWEMEDFAGTKKRQKSKPRDTETILVAIKTQRCTYFRRLSFTKLIDVLVLSINWTNAGCQLSLLILSAGTRLDRTFPFIDIKFKIWHFGPYVTWLETPCSSKAKYFTYALRSFHLEWTATIIKDKLQKEIIFVLSYRRRKYVWYNQINCRKICQNEDGRWIKPLPY